MRCKNPPHWRTRRAGFVAAVAVVGWLRVLKSGRLFAVGGTYLSCTVERSNTGSTPSIRKWMSVLEALRRASYMDGISFGNWRERV
jgi:hypothetical protein